MSNPRTGVLCLSALLLAMLGPPVHAQHLDRSLDHNLADARLLRNVEPLEQGTAHLMRLHPVRFHVQSPVAGALLGPLRLGFVAQELQAVYPGLVLRDFDAKGTLRVEYGQLIPVLTRAFQEQYTRLNQLESQQDALNRELVSLRAENGRLTVGLAALSVGPRAGGSNAGPNTAAQILELQQAVRQLQGQLQNQAQNQLIIPLR